jgi:glycosyltransferase involved in cell wall biosynthesis
MSASPIRVVHTVASLKHGSGGMSRSVPALCEALGALGLDVALVSQAARWPEDTSAAPDPALVRTELVPAVNFPRLRMSFAPGYESRLERICAGASILHDHGLWLPVNHSVARVAARTGVPRVVSPRGMLDAWSLEYRSWKKGLAWRAYQRRDLASVRAFCVTSEQEAESLRALGFRQPVAVVPNGVTLPVGAKAGVPGARIRTALFLSRLHPKKGLPDLVRAWAAIRPAGWRLVVAGPDEGGHRRAVESDVRSLGLAENITFTGPADEDSKWRLMLEADLFVLPTLSENFGIVVAEALACAVPVIATRGAPWGELSSCGCGWWVDTGAPALEAALREALALPDAARAEMGARGRALVVRKYVWAAVARSTGEFYAWLLGTGTRPACLAE